ncbi:bzip family transcription factor [Pyrenophora tritici-repentis]|nr:bzip family transcription factor [Pyrenophora tritici-repentis]
MATAVQSAMTMAPFNGHPNQCVDPNEFFDFGQMPSPTQPATLKREQSTISNINSPTSTNIDDDLQTPAKPSHEYERFKQQTGLPSGSIAGLSAGYNPGFAAFSSTGLDEYAMMGGDSTMDGTWGNGLPIDVGMNMGIDYRQNSFVYSEASQDDFVDPSAITQDTHQPNSNVRVWPGMHQQAALAKAAAQQQQQRNASSSMQDNNQGLLPHIIRAKKDEEDMDEDERLLASEEGKKLSSKERRQLRNKVSARAFRSRRKEYIGQLEGEVAMKVNEANELRTQNRLLMEENARSRAFIERLLRHQAFTPFLEELSRDESLQLKAPMTSMSSSSAPAPTAPAPAQFPQQQFNGMAQGENTQVGMTMVPEPQIDFAMLNINNNANANSWGVNNGFNFQQPVAFAVTELPEGPANPLDIEAMSGKGYSALFHGEDDAPAEAKAGYPVIERPAQSTQAVATIEETEEEDEEYALYFSSPTTIAASAPLEDQENIFTNPDKALAHYSLVISEEANEAHLADRLQRKIAAMNTVMQRVADMTSMLDS